MNRAILFLTRKDANRQVIGPLVTDVEFLKPVTTADSLYSFDFDSQGGDKLEFFLVGDNCTTFFNLLAILADTGGSSVTSLITADSSGSPKGVLEVSLARVKTFTDRISLFSYSFVLDGGAPFAFNLTSSDASSFFLAFDYILWSNPPNPPNHRGSGVAVVNYAGSSFRRKYLTSHKHTSRLKRLVVAPLRWFWDSIPSYLAFYVLVLVIGYAAYHGVHRATVIAAFHMPPENKEKPLPFSGEVVADVLMNAITAVKDEAEGRVVPPPCDARAANDIAFGGLTARASTSFEVGGPVTVEVNGLSASAVISEARQVLGRERRISGDVVLKDSSLFQLMASANDAGPWTVTLEDRSLKGLETAGCQLAESILTDTDRNILASALIRRGEYRRVIGLYGPTSLDERDPDALNNLGVALMHAATTQTDQVTAMARFRQAIVLTKTFHRFGIGNFPEAYYNLGYAFEVQGRSDDAVAEYREALAIRPDFAEAHYNLGSTLEDQGHSDDAIAEYRKALALKPNDAEAHNNLGHVLADQGHSDDAIAEYRKALALKPDFVLAHYNLGAALADEGHFDDAIAEYRKALALKPEFAVAHYGVGVVLTHQGHFDDAIAEYRKALALKPDFAEAHYGLGVALADQGHVEDATAEYRKALALKPDFAEARAKLEQSVRQNVPDGAAKK